MYLYVCGECTPYEVQRVEAHLQVCSSCTTALAEHQILKKSLAGQFAMRKLDYYSQDN